MKQYMYVIVLEGERGTHHTVRKCFTTIEKAERYLQNNCSVILHGFNDESEKIVARSIIKVEVV